MSKIIISGRGGSGKSTVTTLLARTFGKQDKVLVVDTDESNLCLYKMLGHKMPEMNLIDYLGGKPAVGKKLLASIQSDKGEEVNLFEEDLTIDGLPSECISRNGNVSYMRIGKIEHSMEGCACPMGAVARSFLKKLKVRRGERVLVDTEAGIEHFGRGLFEGVDTILVIVDPSYESIIFAGKTKRLTEESGKSFFAMLNKVDETTEPPLRQELEKQGITIRGILHNSLDITKANLIGIPLETDTVQESINQLASTIYS